MAEDEHSLRQIKTLETTITQTIESPYPPSSELEKAALQKESRDSLIGFAAAFLVAMSATVGGGLLVYSGYPVAGSIFGLSGVASIVGAFLKTSHNTPRQTSDDD